MNAISEQNFIFLNEPTPIRDQHWDENVLPLVSISCITYNHASYLRDALEGFLMQRTTFPVEILIHDDASTDGTVDLIRHYEQQYPRLIFPIYQKENQYSQGVRGMMLRFNFPRARGKYIALCEGDDYWIDPLKLQKQIKIFHENPDTIICGARSKTWNQNENRFTTISPSLEKQITCMTPQDFFYLGDWVKTCTRMVSKEALMSIPLEYIRDYRQVHYLLAKNPNRTFRCLEEVVAVYREHAAGVFSGANSVDVLVYNFESKVLLASLFSDDRLHSMRERAADAARQLAQARTLGVRKRIYYKWQHIFLLYGDFSLAGIKRMLLRAYNSLALYFNEFPKIKRLLKPLVNLVRNKLIGH